MTVAFLRKTELAVGALTTTVPGADVVLDGLGSLKLPVRCRRTVDGDGGDDKVTFTDVQFAVDDLAIVTTQAEFDDPAGVFRWRVRTTPTPDRREERRLERLAEDGITVEYATGEVTVTVPRLPTETTLQLEIRDETTLLESIPLGFNPTDSQITKKVKLSGNTPIVIIVQGYAPTLVKRSP